jgi:diguanylate cyclase (GGDEF)-like protein
MSNMMLEKTTVETEDIAARSGLLTDWGTRGFLFDMDSSLYVLREQMVREVGQEFTADIFYQAGFAGTAALASFVIGENPSGDGFQRLEAALDHLSRAGYATLTLESRRPAGEVRIRAENSAEAALMQGRAGRSGYACDYLRGLLRGLVEALSPSPEFHAEALECVETSCVANDDPECHFIIAPAAHLAQHGYRQGDPSHNSVRETLMRLNRQLEDVLEAAKRDALTGLFNRAHFESVLRNKIEYAKRRTDTLSVAMIDLDGFKEVNDGMGHAMGDLALRQVGHLLGAQARDTDLVARYGGDEFAWLMPGTSVEAAIAVADRIRRLVQDMRLETDLPISLSIGIASCPDDAADMTTLIDFADIAMYQAKEAGGNKVSRYAAAHTKRGLSKKRSRKPRSRPSASRIIPPRLREDDLPRLDLGD